jgi:pimeloyl-ACP methyl ester carboxylesterase
MLTGYEDKTAELRDLRLHWLEWGIPDAPPMVLLHGLTGHAHIWDHMAPDLAQEYRLLAPDQRGHGDSAHTDTYATHDFVADLEALRQHWGLERFVLMGLSMGGHNAIAYAAAHPQRVSHLIIIDIPPRLDPKSWPTRAQLEAEARAGHAPFATFVAAVENARAGNPTAPEENLRYRTHWNLDASRTLKWDAKVQVTWDPADLTKTLEQIRIPTLLVRGGKTYALPEAIAAQMIAALPDGELAEIAESGHSVPTDRPQDLTPVVLEWLSRRRTTT